MSQQQCSSKGKNKIQNNVKKLSNIQQKDKDSHFHQQQLPLESESSNTSRLHSKHSRKNSSKHKQQHRQQLCSHAYITQPANLLFYLASAHIPGCQYQTYLGYSQNFGNFANVLDACLFSPAITPFESFSNQNNVTNTTAYEVKCTSLLNVFTFQVTPEKVISKHANQQHLALLYFTLVIGFSRRTMITQSLLASLFKMQLSLMKLDPPMITMEAQTMITFTSLNIA